jgi:hypothetical protein
MMSIAAYTVGTRQVAQKRTVVAVILTVYEFSLMSLTAELSQSFVGYLREKRIRGG